MAEALNLGAVLFRVAVKGLVRDLIPGSNLSAALAEEIGPIFCEKAWGWLSEQAIKHRQTAIDALALMVPLVARGIVEEEAAAAGLADDRTQELAHYLSAVPMAARAAVARPNDRGTPHTLLSQLPRSSADLMRFLPIRPPRFRPGEPVLGHDYELETLLGQGGFGEVWKARNVFRPGAPSVALKFCVDDAMTELFRRELQLIDRAHGERPNENIVRLIGTAQRAEPPFLIYEYVDGGNLVSWLADLEGRPAPPREVLRILKMTARGLAAAHARGIVHRDLKPANLLVTRDGQVKIADFGIGAVLAGEEGAADSAFLAEVTSIKGAFTPLYAEAAQQDGEAMHPRSDIYALGVIAFQLLVGDVRRPVPPDVRGHLEEAGVPEALIALVIECLTVPTKRIQDAGALLARVEAQVADLEAPPPAAEPAARQAEPEPEPEPERELEPEPDADATDAGAAAPTRRAPAVTGRAALATGALIAGLSLFGDILAADALGLGMAVLVGIPLLAPILSVLLARHARAAGVSWTPLDRVRLIGAGLVYNVALVVSIAGTIEEADIDWEVLPLLAAVAAGVLSILWSGAFARALRRRGRLDGIIAPAGFRGRWAFACALAGGIAYLGLVVHDSSAMALAHAVGWGLLGVLLSRALGRALTAPPVK